MSLSLQRRVGAKLRLYDKSSFNFRAVNSSMNYYRLGFLVLRVLGSNSEVVVTCYKANNFPITASLRRVVEVEILRGPVSTDSV